MILRKYLLALLLLLTCGGAFAANLTDTFVRANEDPMSTNTWTFVDPEFTGARIVSNVMVPTSSTIAATLSWRTDSQNDYSQVTLGALVSNTETPQPSIQCKSNGSGQNNMYTGGAYWGGSAWIAYVDKRLNGTWTAVYDGTSTPMAFAPVTGDTLATYRVAGVVYLAIHRVSTGAWVVLGSGAETGLTGGYDCVRFSFGMSNLTTYSLTQWANYDTFAANAKSALIIQQLSN